MIAKIRINKNNLQHVKAVFEILAIREGKETAIAELGEVAEQNADAWEAELSEKVILVKEWQPDLQVQIGEHYTHNDNTYVVIQAHTTQADWQPQDVPALFLLKPKVNQGETYPQWVQPVGSHDAYNIGDRVTFEGSNYESLINGNVWSPTAYPQGWQQID
jgi:hypothetical protein